MRFCSEKSASYLSLFVCLYARLEDRPLRSTFMISRALYFLPKRKLGLLKCHQKGTKPAGVKRDNHLVKQVHSHTAQL